MRNEELLSEEGQEDLTYSKRKEENCTGHILRGNCFLNHVIKEMIERRIEVTGRRGRRHRRLLDDLKKNVRYWELEEETPDCTQWKTGWGRGHGAVIRQVAG